MATAFYFNPKTVIEGQASLDSYLKSCIYQLDLGDSTVATIPGSLLAKYAQSNHSTSNEITETTITQSQNNHASKELSLYEQCFGVSWKDVDTFHIRCIDERRTDGTERNTFLSFATAGCGCYCESASEDLSLDHTASEFLSIIRLWQKHNPDKSTINIEIEPHESCGAVKMALAHRYPDIDIHSEDVDAAAIAFALKLKLKIKSIMYSQSDLAHLDIDIKTLPLARVFPKEGHPATCALVSRLDISGINPQSSTTNFSQFDQLLGLPGSPLSAFAITGEDTEKDLHYLVDRIILAPMIAVGDHGLVHFGREFEFSPQSHTFKVYVEYNGITDLSYLHDIVTLLSAKLTSCEMHDKVELIAIDRLA